MHEVLVNRLGGLSLLRKSVVRLTDRPNMTLDVYRRRKTTIQQQQHNQLLPQFSMDLFETLHICCGQIEDVHVGFLVLLICSVICKFS